MAPRKLTLAEYLRDLWLPSLQNGNLRATTLASYEVHVTHHLCPRLGATRLQDLNRDVIGAQRFLEIEARLRSVLAGHSEMFERRLTLASGEVRDALFSYVPDIEDGQVRGMYGLVRDSTALKRRAAGQQEALLPRPPRGGAARERASGPGMHGPTAP